MKLRPLNALLTYIVICILLALLIYQVFIDNALAQTAAILPYFFFVIMLVMVDIAFHYFLDRRPGPEKETEDQYKQLFFDNPNPMWVYDIRSYEFLEVNSSATEKYGYSRNEFLSMTVLDIRPDEDRSQVLDFIKKVQTKEKRTGIWSHIAKDGERFIVSVQSHPIQFNRKECALVLAVDITRQVLQEKQLEESYKKEIELNDALASHIDLIKKSNKENQRFADIISRINNVVIITDHVGTIVWVNKAFSKVTQYTFAEAAGKKALNLLKGPDTDVDMLGAAILHAKNSGTPAGAEIVHYTKNGERYWVEIMLTPMFSEEGDYEGLISVENVITERKLRENKINEQNQVLRQIAWVSSHEVRKPVSSILSLVNLLKNANDDHEREECLQLLEVCSGELDDIVRRIARKVNLAEL